ncbi:MAG: LamB/YcsF family protein [Candidatus Caenarcaniphilales bacterium]|nr:LamB/YcsF family protein [Candidatus Caenarcaniphilales bacterium]
MRTDYQSRHREERFEERVFYTRSLDLNCDLGQKWGPYVHRDEEALLPFVSSVNIACGAHAGDPTTIYEALRIAKIRSLMVGAHIGYPDLSSFGRKEIRLDNDELKAYVTQQLGTIAGMAKTMGLTLTHFRPHGAMYYKCVVDNIFAEILAKAVSSFSAWINFVGPAGNFLNAVSDSSGLKTIGEVHLDRPYRRDGTLYKFANSKNVPFEFAIAQAKSLIFQNKLILEGGRRVRVPFKTIHLNMDRPYSVELAEAVFTMLKEDPTPFDGISSIENLQLADFEPIKGIGNLYE